MIKYLALVLLTINIANGIGGGGSRNTNNNNCCPLGVVNPRPEFSDKYKCEEACGGCKCASCVGIPNG